MPNPVELLEQSWIDTIKTEAPQAEKQGKLTKKQLALIYEQGWFKMFMPAANGGKQLSLPDILQLEEALAAADGSMGWTVTLCAGAGWFGGFMDAKSAATLLNDANVCLAGSGAVDGTAEINGDNYIVNGQWPYASGTADATCFTANCVITKDGQPIKDDKGADKIIAILLDKNEVNITNQWNGFGMVATGSHSYEVKNLKIAQDKTFDIKMEPVVKNCLYYYPFQQFAEATLTVNMTGMGMHFMDLCGKMIADKRKSEKPTHVNMDALQQKYDALLQKLQVARQKLYYAVDMSWQVCQANKEISPSLLYKVSAASFVAVNVVRDCVNTLFPYCGLKAADKDSEINRVWRDIQTAGQHSMLVGDGN